MCFDTTSTTTGRVKGACSLLESHLNKNLIYLPCRHHIHELIVGGVFSALFGPSCSPNMAMFECFWATVCKTVRPMLLDRRPVCLSVLSVCDVGVLWPNSWMDPDKTWHVCRPQTVRPGHIVLDGDPVPLPPKGHSSQFSAHVCCCKMAAWIKMSLGMEVGLGPGHIVLDGDPDPLPKKGA